MRPSTMCSTLLVLAGCGGGGGGPADEQGSLLILAVPALEEAGRAYADFREAAGYRVELSLTAELFRQEEKLQDVLAERARGFAAALAGGERGFLLLLGDANELERENPAYLPTFIASRETDGYSWWAEGDGPYADTDGDLVPELAVGRLPFHTAEQLEQYRQRLSEHEAGYRPGPWNKTLAAFAGEGGFGPEIDGLLEMAAGWIFDEMSYDFDMSMTYASPNSAYHLPYGLWEADYAERVEGGAVVVPYIGHTLGDVGCCEQNEPARRGLLTFFSCSDGDFQYGDQGSLAERVLLRPQGPIGTMAATTTSHPYGNAILPREIGHALLDLRAPTYGEAVSLAKHGAVYRLDELRAKIDAAAKLYVTEPLPELVAEHIVMYNLLGDPTAPTNLPAGSVDILEPDAPQGGKLVVAGNIRNGPHEGTATVTLELRRTEVKDGLADCSSGCTPEQYASNHQLANDKVLSRAEGAFDRGRFSLELDLPALAPGSYYLKAFALGEDLDAAGSLEFVVP